MRNNFTTIARFTYSTEAQIIKGRLESCGIQALLQDNYTIDTDPLVSVAVGGVKLRVREEDVIEARHILEGISKYSVGDDGQLIICPNCSSKTVELMTTITDFKSFISF